MGIPTQAFPPPKLTWSTSPKASTISSHCKNVRVRVFREREGAQLLARSIFYRFPESLNK